MLELSCCQFQHGFPSLYRPRAACFWQRTTLCGTAGVTGPFLFLQHRCQGSCNAGDLVVSETCKPCEERSTFAWLRRRCFLGNPPRFVGSEITKAAAMGVSVTAGRYCCRVSVHRAIERIVDDLHQDETSKDLGLWISVSKSHDSLNQFLQQTRELAVIQVLGERGRMDSPMVSQCTVGWVSESTTINETEVRPVCLLWESPTQGFDQNLSVFSISNREVTSSLM